MSFDSAARFVSLVRHPKLNEHKKNSKQNSNQRNHCQQQHEEFNEAIQLAQFNSDIVQPSKVKRVSSCRSFDLLPSLSSSSSGALSSITSETSLLNKDHSCYKLNSHDLEVTSSSIVSSYFLNIKLSFVFF